MKKRVNSDKKEFGFRVLGLAGNVLDAVFSVLLVVVVAILIYKGAQKCYDYGFRIFTEPAMTLTEGHDVEITIPVDFSAKQLGELFETNGLSRDSKLFILQYYCSEYKDDIKGGTYTVNTSMTTEEMLGVIAEVNIEKDKLNKELEEKQKAEEEALAAKEKENEEDDDQPIQEINMDDLEGLTEDDIR